MARAPLIDPSVEAVLRAEVASREADLVALAAELIAFDTTARHWDDVPGEEAGLQEHLARRLARAGFEVDLWEPDPALVVGRQVPAGFHFRGRPQLVARLPGTGGGRSLMLCGHVDVVPAEPREAWRSDPFLAEVRHGRLFGRGACDMKGGVAAMVVAAEALAALDLGLPGDLLVCSVTDEESTGAGGLAAVAHGVRADAGLIPEPTDFDVWTACRGTLLPRITVPGRVGHAGLAQPPAAEGGAVSAIDEAALILVELHRLRAEWQARLDLRHPHLAPPHVIPTAISAGEWLVTYPVCCELRCHVTYLPRQADAEGWGSAVEREVVDRVQRAVASDPWLREHPPSVRWSVDVPPMEVSLDEPVVHAALEASRAVGRPGRPAALTTWFDGVSFTRAGTPTVAFGPGRIQDAHTIDESVAVADLVASAQALALAALRSCA